MKLQVKLNNFYNFNHPIYSKTINRIYLNLVHRYQAYFNTKFIK